MVKMMSLELSETTLANYIKLAKQVGQRFDLMQGGGGNVSIKLDHANMLVTHAGVDNNLSETEVDYGNVIVHYPTVAAILTKNEILNAATPSVMRKISIPMLKQSLVDGNFLPSAEVFMHACAPYQYGLHLHPIQCNIITALPDANELLSNMFPRSVFTGYATPGIDISINYHQTTQQYKETYREFPKQVFLGNHGVMLASDSIEEIITMVEEMISRIETSLSLDFSPYRSVSDMASLIQPYYKRPMIAYLCEDSLIQEMIKNHRSLLFFDVLYPDYYIYNGHHPCELKDLDDSAILNYVDKYNHPPKVLLYNDRLYFIARNTKAARDMEEVYKAHLLIAKTVSDSSEFSKLSQQDLKYITF